MSAVLDERLGFDDDDLDVFDDHPFEPERPTMPPLVPGSLTARVLADLWRSDRAITLLGEEEFADGPDLLPTVIAHLAHRARMTVCVESDSEQRREHAMRLSGRVHFGKAPTLNPTAIAARMVVSDADNLALTFSARIERRPMHRLLHVVAGSRGVWLRSRPYVLDPRDEGGCVYEVPFDVILAAVPDDDAEQA